MHLGGNRTKAAPGWFTRAVSHAPTRHRISVDGCAINVLRWGITGRTPIIALHGSAANTAWWEVIAPLLTHQHDVVSFDFSGHGESGRRASYDLETWAREALAVAKGASSSPPIILGHSMGGVVAGMTALLLNRVHGVVLVDTPIGQPADLADADPESSFRHVRPHQDREGLVHRFRPLPRQPSLDPHVQRYVAERSIVAANGGWEWKFDRVAFPVPPGPHPDDIAAALLTATFPVSVIVGGESRVVPHDIRNRWRSFVRERTGSGGGSFVEIADGHHHLMLDHPRELAAAILDACSGPNADPSRPGAPVLDLTIDRQTDRI